MKLSYAVFLFILIFCFRCEKSRTVISGKKLQEYFIPPNLTDPAINSFLNNHYICINEGTSLKDLLVVFLPGTYRQPQDYKVITQKAANLGYHSVGLMYPNSKAINDLCSPTNDSTCHRRARLEIIDGTDRHPGIDVNYSNSIINRLVKLLLYLTTKYPSENWGQFIVGGELNWSKIIISGHSQGAGHAGVIGKFYPIKKVIMFSIIDFLSNRHLADWESLSVRKEKYFSLFNPKDELLDYRLAQLAWEHLGMRNYGDIVNVDSVAFPYHHSHILITRIEPTTSLNGKYHNGTVLDEYLLKDLSGNYVLDKTYEYLLNEE
jgi:hypothetical protein